MVDDWLVESDLIITNHMHYEVAIGIDSRLATAYCLLLTAYSSGTFDGEQNGTGVRPWRHHKVILQLSALVAVINQVDAGINPLVFHPPVGRDVGAPLLGVVAKEVVGLAGQLCFSGYGSVGICSHQLQANHRVRRPWPIVRDP